MPKAIDRSTLNLPTDKFCQRCETTKVSDDFHLSKKEKDGLQHSCKACMKEMAKIATQQKLAYKPFSALLQQVLIENNHKKLLRLVNKVYDTAMSDTPQAVIAQKMVIERLEGKLREEIAFTSDDKTIQLVSGAAELMKNLKTVQVEQELMLPVGDERGSKTTH